MTLTAVHSINDSMETNPLQQILSRRAEIAKKMASYEALKKEDAELEIAQRVLERISGVNGSITTTVSPGAESDIMNVLSNRGGSIDFNELHSMLQHIQLNSLRSILSRMKSKGLIDRKGDLILSKENPAVAGPKGLGDVLMAQDPIGGVPA